MGILSSNNSWTNQAKAHSNSEGWHARPVCAPKRSSLLNSRKGWGSQANSAYKERKTQLKNGGNYKPPQSLMASAAELRQIQRAGSRGGSTAAQRAARQIEAKHRKEERKQAARNRAVAKQVARKEAAQAAAQAKKEARKAASRARGH